MVASKIEVPLTVGQKLVWKPAKKNEHQYKLIVHKAATGRARCRRCSQFIEKGELRCGIPMKHPGGDNGWISAWQHLGCTRMEGIEDEADAIYGLNELDKEQQALVISTLTSDEVPVHLRPLDPDDLIKRGKLEEVDAPQTLLRPLLPFQREGLGWMVKQEKTEIKGGILADEMGMGKTIQTVSLLLSNRVSGPTLIVCPVSSMLQWETEIKEHVLPGTLSVLVVYRTTKTTRQAMENADVVLTTYPMLEQAWRSLVNEIKVPCPYCGLLFIPRQLVVHNRYFCGPRAKKTSKQQKREKNPGEGRNHKVQSEATIKKGLRTLHVDIDDANDEPTSPNGPSETMAAVTEESDGSPVKKRGVVGPMGMYEELMREAGRRVRSRWDPVKREDLSSSEESFDSSDSESSVEYDSAAEQAEEAEAAEREAAEQQLLAEFCCEHCHFQVLRFPFCPKTGQHHVLTAAMREAIETDTGGDKVNLDASPFHSIKWARIVLDEAHRIKGRTTSTARSAFALSSEYRWCLTGTPLQNRVGDVYSLLRFLRISPYARYFCAMEGCSCSSLSHPFSGTSLHQCIFCGHGPVQHYAYFNRYVLNPITRYGYIGDGRKGMIMLTNDVFSKAMLRRTKTERAADLQLPPLITEVRRIQLTPEERNFYESLYKKSTSEFDTFISKGTILHNYAHIFQLLSRLRQSLDHPLLVVKGMNVGEIVHAKGVCGVCGEGVENNNIIKAHPCRHVFHRLCLSQFLESAPDEHYHCPTCFVRINVDLRQLNATWDDEDEAGMAALPPELEDELDSEADERALADNKDAKTQAAGEDAIKTEPYSSNDAQESKKPSGRAKKSKNTAPTASSKKADGGILSRLNTSEPLHGTKLNAIADYITSIPADEKAIVFSQFGDMLDLVQHWLQKRFVKAVKLVGSLTLTQRQAILQAFLHDPSVRVILISLKAGGEGLNLQVANHVVLADPWWNPAVEMQAVQRAHRIGQSKPVQAIRFVTENTVEERMVELQDKKMLVFEGTIDGKMTSLHKLSEEDLQFLFTR